MTRKTGIQRAIKAAGGQSELARQIGVTYQAVQRWARTGHIPYKRCMAIKKKTGIKLSVLRPDIWNVKS